VPGPGVLGTNYYYSGLSSVPNLYEFIDAKSLPPGCVMGFGKRMARSIFG
jgi:hypothetical protein